jgi:paraquat-inducible protein B
LKTGNLLTGQLYIALELFPDAPKAKVDWASNPPELPSTPGALQSLQDSLTRLVAKLNGVPFDAIGKNAQQTLASANVLLKRLDTEVMPQARDALASAHAALQENKAGVILGFQNAHAFEDNLGYIEAFHGPSCARASIFRCTNESAASSARCCRRSS